MGVPALSPSEIRLVEQLRQHPELQARFQSIVDLTRNADGPLPTADEVESRLIQELRQLGHTTMNQWAAQAEERVSVELQRRDPGVRRRKKNADVVVCLRVGDGEGSGLAQPEPELSAAAARALGRESARQVAAAGPGADGLWE